VAPPPATGPRLVGLDVARCLALLGMVTTHVLDPRDPSGEIAFGQAVAGGRSAALFAVLAGVSIALVTGRGEPPRGRARLAASVGLVVRAALLAGIGLLLGVPDSGLAVILAYYGVLFVLAVPFLGLRPPALLALAAGWLVAAPVVSHWLRPDLPPRSFANPTPGRLVDETGGVVAELLLTGYYPAVPWLAYVLVGMAVGRLDLSGRRTPALLAAGGATLAVVAHVVSDWAVHRPAAAAALVGPGAGASDVDRLLDEVSTGMFGTTPPGDTAAWLLVDAPHSATPFDLAATIGSSLLVVGAALLAVRAVARHPAAVRLVAVVFGAGTMTLSLYSLHVLLRTPSLPPPDGPDGYVAHLLVLVALGATYVALGRRGPLERVVGRASSAAAAHTPGTRRDRH
jgi:uncharacterized membrane protein